MYLRFGGFLEIRVSGPLGVAIASLALHNALMRLPPMLGEPFGMTGPGTVPHALVTAPVVSSHVVVGSIELMRALKSHLSMKALFGPPDRAG